MELARLASSLGDPAIAGSIVVMTTTLVVLLLQVRAGRGRTTGRRVLVVGSLVLVAVATTVPSHWSGVAPGSALELRPLFGGLGGGLLDLLQREITADVELLVLNALLYVPVGALLRWAWPTRGAAVLVVPLTLSLAIETVQFVVLARTATTDDVIVNVAGAMAGYLAVGLVGRLTRRAPVRPQVGPGPPGDA